MKLKQVAIAPDVRKWPHAFAVQTFVKRLGTTLNARLLEPAQPYINFGKAQAELATQKGEIEFAGIIMPENHMLLGQPNLQRAIDVLKVDPDDTKRGRRHNLSVLIMYDDSQILTGEGIDERQITMQRNFRRVEIVRAASRYEALGMLIGDMYASRVTPGDIDPVIRNYLLSSHGIGPYKAYYEAARDYLKIFSFDRDLKEKLEKLTTN